jgi:hypothetical protein
MLEVLQTYKEMNRIPDVEGMPRLEHYLRKAEGWQEASFNSHFLSNMAQFNLSISAAERLAEEESRSSKDSLHSSKTLKHKPSMNIYTHREVNELMEREKYLN